MKNGIFSIDHPFLVKLHYAFQNDTKLYMIMDFCKVRPHSSEFIPPGVGHESLQSCYHFVLSFLTIHLKFEYENELYLILAIFIFT
jgi:hypothetical protein